MKSIDMLREYAGRFDNSHDAWSGIARDLSSIADAIEQEVGDMRGFCERLDDAATKREDVTLWGVDYMPNPLDADGKPIHVGDVMENIVCPPVHREVTGVGVECFYGWDDGNGRYSQFDVACYRHHHAPTVEEVLREFYVYAERGKEHHREDVDDAVLAEYAAKLRLAGEDA